MKTPIPLLFVLLASGMAPEAAQENERLERKKTPAKVSSMVQSPSAGTGRITIRRYIFNGIAVQAVKARQPGQVLNPLAPPGYFAANDNVVRHSRSGRVEGLNLLSLKF